MTLGNTRTILSISLMAVAIMTVTGMALVDAAPSEKAKDKIPAKVIERQAEKWKSQYDSEKHFKQTTKETVEYLTADFGGGWNTDVQQASLIVYNFDSKSGKRSSMDKLVSLLSTKAQIEGTYSETEAIERYHTYIQSLHPAPQGIGGIDAKINKLLGDNSYSDALEAYEARNLQASLGAVPEQLIQSQPLFWGKVLLLAGCGYDSDCDVELMDKIADFQHPDPNVEHPVLPLSAEPSIYDLILPKAFAGWVEVQHTAYQYISADTCDGSPCYFYTSVSGTGQKTPNASSGGTHTTDTTIYSYASDTSNNSNHYHSVSSQLTDPAATNSLTAGGYGTSIWKDGYLTKSSSESTYKATNTANAWIYQ